MKKFLTFVFGVLFLSAMSFTFLSADMKCGSGKCGGAMKLPTIEKPACCKTDKVDRACKCSDSSKCTCKDKNNCNCDANAKACNCSDSTKCLCEDKNDCKCDANKNAPKATMKCGKGKCG